MKKKVVKTVGASAFMALLVFNFVLSNNSRKKNDESFSLNNIEALHASAGEYYCDQKNKESCTITYQGTTGYSTGNHVLSNH